MQNKLRSVWYQISLKDPLLKFQKKYVLHTVVEPRPEPYLLNRRYSILNLTRKVEGRLD